MYIRKKNDTTTGYPTVDRTTKFVSDIYVDIGSMAYSPIRCLIRAEHKIQLARALAQPLNRKTLCIGHCLFKAQTVRLSPFLSHQPAGNTDRGTVFSMIKTSFLALSLLSSFLSSNFPSKRPSLTRLTAFPSS